MSHSSELSFGRKPRRSVLVRGVTWVLGGVLLCVVVMSFWFSTGYRSVPALTGYVSDTLESALAPVTAEMASLEFELALWEGAVRARMETVALHDPEGKQVLMLPEIRASLPLWRLLMGEVQFRRIDLIHPELHVQMGGEDGEAAVLQLGAGLAQLATLSERLGAGVIRLEQALIWLNGGDEPFIYEVPSAALHFRGRGQEIRIEAEAQLGVAPVLSHVQVQASYDTALEQATIAAQVSEVSMALLRPLVRPLPGWLKGLDLTIGGTLSATLDGGDVRQLAVEVNGREGVFSASGVLPEPLKLREMDIKARMASPGLVQIESFSLAGEALAVNGTGQVHLSDAGTGFELRAQLAELPLEQLYRYWPLELSMDAREWVTANLSAGTVSKASVALTYAPEAATGEPLRAAAEIEVAGATVAYLPGFPKVTGVQGTAKITDNSLDVTVSSGAMLSGTRLQSGTVRIADFSSRTLPMTVDLSVSAPAKDVATFLGEPYLNVGSELQLDPETVQGQGSARVKLTVPLYISRLPEGEPEVRFDVAATLSDVSQKGILGKWDIAGMNGTLAATNKAVELKADTQLNGIAAALEVAQQYLPEEQSRYHLAAAIPAARMVEFGFAAPPQVGGVVGVDATLVEQDGNEQVEAELDLNRASLALAELGWRKPAGVPGNLSLAMRSAGDRLEVSRFALTGGGMEARGKLAQQRGSGKLTSLKLDRLRGAGTDVSVDYKEDGRGRRLSVQGRRLDLSGAEDAPGKHSGDNPLEHLLGMRLNLALDELALGKGRLLGQVNGYVQCEPTHCVAADMKARTGNGVPVSFRLQRRGGVREVVMASQDAGGVLKAFDVSDQIKGGALDYKARYAEGKPGRPQEGRLLMTDFRIVKGPILTKILSLASLTGLLDTLSGKGIAFTKLSVDTRFDGETVRIKNGKAYGSALGLTGEGNIAPFGGTVHINGTLVPAYSANSILGKIPLFGDLLIGRQGEGVFAAKYSVKGAAADPEVSVNPLSLLTPGFLRNLFDVFEDAPEE